MALSCHSAALLYFPLLYFVATPTSDLDLTGGEGEWVSGRGRVGEGGWVRVSSGVQDAEKLVVGPLLKVITTTTVLTTTTATVKTVTTSTVTTTVTSAATTIVNSTTVTTTSLLLLLILMLLL